MSSDPGDARQRQPAGNGAATQDGASAGAASTSAAEFRDRSVRGVAAVALRGAAVRAVGLVVNIVLARLLLPSEFGLLAFGLTLLVVGTLLTDAGVGANLIRTTTPPTRQQLSAVLGLQLGVTVVLAVSATAFLLPGGCEQHVTAVMLWALVPATFRVPATVQLERDLRFKAVAVAEVLETLAYAVLAIGLVLLGAGVWGVAAATVLRSVVGATALQRSAPMRVLRPTADWSAVAPLLTFGLVFQLGYVLVLIRDQGVNLVTLALAGTAGLGYWSLAQRVMLVPFLLFESLWRVSFPSVARLLEAGHDVRADLTRALSLGSFLTGLIVVPLAVAAPVLVPLVFGERWVPVVPVIPLAAAGLMLSGPLSAVGAGFLTATGRVRLVALANGASILPWAVLLPWLLPRFGVTANGIGWFGACVADALVLGFALQRYGKVPVLRSTGPTAGCAALVGAAGLGLVMARHLSVVPGLGVAVLSTALYLALAGLLARRALIDLMRLLGRVHPSQRAATPADR